MTSQRDLIARAPPVRYTCPAMTPFERNVRARIYTLLAGGARRVDAAVLTAGFGWDTDEVTSALQSLAEEHRIALTEDGEVWMAHPFSGIPTPYRAVIGDRSWNANCAWDALAILSLLGDGEARCPGDLVWTVTGGTVSPEGLIHLLVPARLFWEDIGFT